MHTNAPPTLEQVIAAIGLVYEAALDARLEPQALDGLKDLLSCGSTQMATYDRGTGEVLACRTSSEGVPAELGAAYLTEWGRQDPLPAVTLQFPTGTVVRSHEHIDPVVYEASDFFRGFLAPQGYRWSIAGTLHVTD